MGEFTPFFIFFKKYQGIIKNRKALVFFPEATLQSKEKLNKTNMLARLKPQLRVIKSLKPVEKIKNLPLEPLHNLNRWLLPGDRYGRRLFWGTVGFIVFLLAIAQIDQGLGFFLLLGPLLPVFILAIVGGFICFILSVGHAFKSSGHPAPLIAMLLGLYLVFKPATPPSAEQVYFQKHKAKYQEVVELVHQEKLIHNEQCQNSLFAVPSAYQHLTANCVSVNREHSGLVVEFTLFTENRPLVYSETRHGLQSVNACHGRGRIANQIDRHWYICQRN